MSDNIGEQIADAAGRGKIDELQPLLSSTDNVVHHIVCVCVCVILLLLLIYLYI